MAKVSYVDVLPGAEAQFFSGVRSSDRFTYSRLAKKIVYYTKKSVKGVTQRSLLPQISALWSGFSAGEKTAWDNAGDICNLTGWQLFVQDQCIRIKNEIAGVATPSLLHQSWVGNLHIAAPATEAKIIQIHPHFYWVSQKIIGKKSMYQPVLVTEDLALPLSISINYSSSLTPSGGENFAKFYARFWYSYQGVDRYYDLEIPLDYSTVWETNTITLTTLISYVIRYDLLIHIKGLQGDLYFDNIKSEHSGQNWVRDPFCKDINQGFTRAFYQIPKHWAGVILPEGAFFNLCIKIFK